jgi:hypothetical protein
MIIDKDGEELQDVMIKQIEPQKDDESEKGTKIILLEGVEHGF